MAKNPQMPAKQPHIAWRITRVVLHILGKILLWAMIIAGTAALIAAIAGTIFMTKFSDYLKQDVIPKSREYADSLELDNISLAQTSIIYYFDSDSGEYRELQQLYATQNRIWVSYDEIPSDLVHATIAIEDKRYLEHDGVDWLRTLSAVRNFIGGNSSFGASTITQQLIKNLSQEDDITVNRKVQEIFRALAVEERYTKTEIMEWYLNTIFLGEGCYGVQSAAEVYFAKDVGELTAAECASLIAITNNPSLYDPYVNPEGNRRRQLIILDEMYAQGYIETEAELEAAKAQEMVFHNGRYDEETYICGNCGFEGPRSEYIEQEEDAYFCPNCNTQNYAVDDNNAYSYFVDTVYRDVVNDLCDKYDLSEQAAVQKLLTGGYRIYSTYDPKAQELVDRVYENPDNVPNTVSTQQLQSAIVLIDNKTGDIIAMSGGVGEKEGSLSLNRATQSKLPTGSSIKPIAVYAPALDAGIITPATVFEDSPFYDDTSWPKNSSGSYSGPCLVLRGVAASLNTISVKTLDALGTQNSYDFLTQKMGITTLVDSLERGGQHYTDIAYAPLGLGELTYGLTVREMTQAYSVFANNGVFREARTYTLVVDPEGNTVLENTQESHTAISEKANYYMTYMLENVVSSGTGTPAYMSNMAAAGKTGTSNNNQTRWFAGYTPYYTAVVWCGYDEPEEVILSDSWTNPAIVMWNQVMKPLHEGLEYRSFPQPDGVGYYSVCSDCGMLAAEACEKDVRSNGQNRVTTVRLFWQDAPKEKCTCHTMVKICEASGKIANEYCEHVEGNTVTERGMLIFNKDWKVNKDEPYVYNEKDEGSFCTLHTADSTRPSTEDPTDPSTEPTAPTEPTEPTDTTEPTEAPQPSTDPAAALPPDEAPWYARRRIQNA